MSWVFLTDHFVYKLKKPVKYDFLDFSTIERRSWACGQEVRLNRRLARDVYLGVIPITRNRGGRLQLGGTGPPLDWVVKMRRLPAHRALDQMIRSHSVTEADVSELATRLTEFYQQSPPLSIPVEQYRRAIEDHIDGNQRVLARCVLPGSSGDERAPAAVRLMGWSRTASEGDLGDPMDVDPPHRLDAAMLKRVHAAQIRLLRLAPDIFDERVCDGRIVDGHGDLRPDHIYFTPHPTMIDCVEFHDEFRQIDVLDELAYLAAECEHHDAGWIGRQVIETYRRTSGDHFHPLLLDFYKTYRACVRAKVSVLHGSQSPDVLRERLLDDANRYLQLADRHATSLGPPVLLVVYGLSGTGKTTLARWLADVTATIFSRLRPIVGLP